MGLRACFYFTVVLGCADEDSTYLSKRMLHGVGVEMRAHGSIDP